MVVKRGLGVMMGMLCDDGYGDYLWGAMIQEG